MSKYGFENEEAIRQRAAAAEHQRQLEAQLEETAKKEALDERINALEAKVLDVLTDYYGADKSGEIRRRSDGWVAGSEAFIVTVSKDGSFSLGINTYRRGYYNIGTYPDSYGDERLIQLADVLYAETGARGVYIDEFFDIRRYKKNDFLDTSGSYEYRTEQRPVYRTSVNSRENRQ